MSSWAFQLQWVDPLEIKNSNFDVVVIDYGFDRQHAGAFPREIVDLMRLKPDGSRRQILAYFSIGEAETYRYYWRDSWLKQRPEWLEPENPDWPNNYLVRYWDPEWHRILFGDPSAYLDRILDAGFDGVYIDGVDKFEIWRAQRPTAMLEMAALVTEIADYGRRRRKGFLIVPQNGDEILDVPGFEQLIDGFGREELLLGESRPGERNKAENITDAVERLQRFAAGGKPVLVAEYTADPVLADAVRREVRSYGFIPYVSERELNRLMPSECEPPGCSR